MAIHPGPDGPALSTLINSQHGVLTAAQAKAGGLPHETLRRRVQRGLWQRLVPGVYALQGAPPSRMQWLIAAQLYAGESSVLTGTAALAVHGIRLPREGLDTLVPHGRRRQNVAHMRIVRTTRMPQAMRSGVLRVAPLARSVVDGCLAAVVAGEPETIDGIVTAALEGGRVQLTELEYELGKAPRRHSADIRAELAKSRAHIRAQAAERFLAQLNSSGPFGSMQNAAIFVGQRRVATAIALWPERAIAVTVDAAPLELSTLTSLGFAVFPTSSDRLAELTHEVTGHIRQALQLRPEARLSPGISLLPLASLREREAVAHA